MNSHEPALSAGNSSFTDNQPPITVHQDAFRTPGIIPNNANSRKQIRQTPKRRRYARDRPQRLQRLCACTLNFGLRFAFSIQDFFAIDNYQIRCVRSALALGEPAALLVITTERHSQLFEQRQREIVAIGARHKRDVHAVNLLDVIVVDLGEDHLLLDTE